MTRFTTSSDPAVTCCRRSGASLFWAPSPFSTEKARARSGTRERSVVKERAVARSRELFAMKLEKVKPRNCRSRIPFPLTPPTPAGSYSQRSPGENFRLSLDLFIRLKHR